MISLVAGLKDRSYGNTSNCLLVMVE